MRVTQRIRRFRLRSRRKLRKYEKRFRHHPRLLFVTIMLAIAGLSLVLVITLRNNTIRLNPRQANIVILHVDNQTRTIPTRENTVGGLLQRAGIIVNKGDVVEPSLDTQIQEDDFRVNVYRASPVTIIDQDKRTSTLSAAQTPRSVTTQAGMTVYAEDTVTAAPSQDFLRDGIGATVTIDRATPVVMNLYGTPLPLRTHAQTVGEVLKEKKIQLAADDTVQPAAETPLTPQTQIFVTRYGTQVSTTEEPVGYTTQTVEDASLSFGTQATRQQGVAGKKSVTYQLNLKNGVVIGKTLIQEVVTQEPVPQIIARGQAVSIPADKEAIMRAAGISSGDYAYVNYIVSRESGWCPTKWQGQVGYCPAYYTEAHPISSAYGYGLCQSTPASKMATAGADWQTNPVTQLKWCSGYAIGRYGSWAGAYQHWISYSWW
jgi:uncharacterized protein YabE (DUF348 family)